MVLGGGINACIQRGRKGHSLQLFNRTVTRHDASVRTASDLAVMGERLSAEWAFDGVENHADFLILEKISSSSTSLLSSST
jgi:hypothetical protein